MQLSPSDPDIQTIVSRIKNGDLDLQPDFQRGEVWSTQKKKRLIDSILRDWYIPPIHTVVVPGSKKQDVLDGQQRLVAIRDFVNGHFPVDGKIQPLDQNISALDGCYYSELPQEQRRLFDGFTIRVMRVTDYRPEEPGELFFRLNAITNVTAAEQRNAFYGPVRQQVKSLVEFFEKRGNTAPNLGFSNSRMAYDDVLSKLLCTIEAGSLTLKLTANVVSDRFRTDDPFDGNWVFVAEDAIESFSLLRGESPSTKFNKATLLSWLIFCASFSIRAKQASLRSRPHFLEQFESLRTQPRGDYFKSSPVQQLLGSQRDWAKLFSIYADRSTSRVLDISSVVLRDFVIHFTFFCTNQMLLKELPLNDEKLKLLGSVALTLGTSDEIVNEHGLEKRLGLAMWGSLA